MVAAAVVAAAAIVVVVVTHHPVGALIGQKDLRELDDEPVELKVLCHCRCELSCCRV